MEEEPTSYDLASFGTLSVRQESCDVSGTPITRLVLVSRIAPARIADRPK